MNGKILWLCALICMLHAACKKEKLDSTWTVNNDGFSTNEVERTVGKAAARLSSGNHDNQNYFRIGFIVGYLPTTGQYKLKYNAPGSIFEGISFYYKGVFYTISSYTENYLTASSIKGKASYTLPPTWFVNYDNQNDSVLINGTFNEP